MECGKKAQHQGTSANLGFEATLGPGAQKFPQGVLPKNSAPLIIKAVRLGELIDLVGALGLGDKIAAGLAFPLLPRVWPG